MTTQHTPGRLKVRGFVNLRTEAGNHPIASCNPQGLYHADEANARRLVACWNACDGLTTEHLENIDMLGGTLAGRFAAFHASERELMDTRDELLEALKGLLSGMFDGPDESDAAALVTKARAAIAKAEGAA